jgi:hypothetical protein
MVRGGAYTPYFPAQINAALGFDAGFYHLAQRFYVGRGGVIGIDQKIAMLIRNHSSAMGKPTASGLINQLP